MDIAQRIAELATHGLDVVQPFDAHAVAREVGCEALRVPSHPYGLLVGNTRALWPRFIAELDAHPEQRRAPHPLDAYVERVVRDVSEPHGLHALYAHAQHAGAYLPFQRIAVAAGLAALSPGQLLIHPSYGPWFGLRAIVLLPGEPPPPSPRIALPCACIEHGCAALFDAACTRPDDWRAWLALRDACPIGRAHRYSDAQIAYHYTKDPRLL